MASKRGKKSERTSKTPEVSHVEERPTEKELIPGKGFYERDWKQVLEKDEDVLFVCGLVQKVYENACVSIKVKAIEEESYPYSVNWAKEMMLDTIQSFFIMHDDGEKSPDKSQSWLEDIEPSSPVIDSWARGAVPMVEKSESSERIRKEETVQEESETDDFEEESLEANPVLDKGKSSLPQSSSLSQSPNNEFNTKRRPFKKTSVNLEMKVISPYTEKSKLLQNESASTGSCTPLSSTAFISVPPLITGIANDVPKHKIAHRRSEVITDQYGRVVETIKLDSRKFPPPSIRPKINTQEKNPIQSNCTVAKASVGFKPKMKKHHQPSDRRTHSLVPYESIHKHRKTNREGIGGINRVEGNRVPVGTKLPSLLDIIDPLPGVTVYENGSSVTGHPSPRTKSKSPRAYLQPIATKGRVTASKSESRRKRQDGSIKFLVSTPIEHNMKTLDVT